MPPPTPPPRIDNPLAAVEEECEHAACKSMLDMLKSAAGMSKSGATSSSSPSLASSTPSAASSSDEAAWRKYHCPLDKDTLGDMTWGVLHSTAAYYPESPTPQEQSLAAGLVHGIAGLYPCTYCRTDFQECIQALPPRVESREAFSVWICKQHNLVNEKLGKPVFPCDLKSLDRRWKTGEPRCWGEKGGEDNNHRQAAADSTPAEAHTKQQEHIPSAPSPLTRRKSKFYIIEPGVGKKKTGP
ncbi:hypothetical protein NSK_003732 [Nannochloropsis salina CCMP1776]|uniref:Sulfhydryl oxidase n=1 Tax=Nannochloropsis salina CCMP1776 TaxID=1027361 RepID=A0A4D9D9Q7_9STRA|nr:hypothetical protein NSK_003732 [Nannochloropsis salina CCMP1776]|eukprot:TFJ85309.1 hypothetical protein NSK_003732 [Nannochloropsis salina CCMP1776]